MKIANYQNLRSTTVTKDVEVMKYMTNHLSQQLDMNFKYRKKNNNNKKKIEKVNMKSSKYPIIEIYRNQNYKQKQQKSEKLSNLRAVKKKSKKFQNI